MQDLLNHTKPNDGDNRMIIADIDAGSFVNTQALINGKSKA